MEQKDEVLDLSVTLTSPPHDVPSGVIASVEVRCDVLSLAHSGGRLTDPLTNEERERLRWYLEEYWKWPFYEFETRGRQAEALLNQVGKRLYQAVFSGIEAQTILQQWQKQPGVGHQITIVSDMPSVLRLPWELLHDAQSFLVLRYNPPISIVRHLPLEDQSTLSTPFEPPLRVLLVTSRPEGSGFIDPRSIARELVDEAQTQVDAGAIALEFLRPPTFPALLARLSDRACPPIQVLHFDGHGEFDEKKEKQGFLLFETEKYGPHPVKASDLAEVLGERGVRLVMLTACKSATSAKNDVLSSVAAQLLRSGIDAVVAMSASFLVTSASRYVESFYRALSQGLSIPMAQERARQTLQSEPSRDIHLHHSESKGTTVTLQDWWVPHYYQQRPVQLQLAKPIREREQSTAPAPLPRLSENMPAEPPYGFSGRAKDLLDIERSLLRRKMVVLHGFGGVGKTALAREAADWLTRTGFYEGACFVSFEHGGDATTLLSGLGTYLAVYNGGYKPNNTKIALAQLGPALKEKQILVIADNVESILPKGDVTLEATARTSLWDVLLELAKMGVGILLTSRDTTFGDGRLAHGNQAMHLSLKGLHPDDAYALANQLLAKLEIDHARAPYEELRHLLVQLDHHPLAIQLVLPSVRERSLTTIQSEFATLLPLFKDDEEAGRNSSLLASLDYSLRRLSQEQRALLPRLAIFEGGANEDDLLAITGIPEPHWATLRSALENASLVTMELANGVQFLRFHPVLVPYLRQQQGPDDGALSERFARQYYGLVKKLRDDDTQHRPYFVRRLVRRELPNLRHALEVLLLEGQVDEFCDMADCISTFLTIFGMTREREILWRRIADAAAVNNLRTDNVLTNSGWLLENGTGEDERRKGQLPEALARLTALLTRIEAQPEGNKVGRGSFAHCRTLYELAMCHGSRGQVDAAERELREALSIIDALIRQEPENRIYARQRGIVLSGHGDVQRAQGQYPQAERSYTEACNIFKDLNVNDLRSQAATEGKLGMLATDRGDYAEARLLHKEAIERFQALGEPTAASDGWFELGRVAQKQKDWVEAELCYRESLAIDERLGDTAGVARTCNQLAIVAVYAERPHEAESWWRRALELDEQIQPGSLSHARHLDNLAELFVMEARAERVPKARLLEAWRNSRKSLAIKEGLGGSARIWATYSILANIAEMRGKPKSTRFYRRCERESYITFAGNRNQIDRQHGQLIASIAEAARGEAELRAKVEADLAHSEERGGHIIGPVQRIWAGEREWRALVEDLDGSNALLVLRVLETLQAQEKPK